MLLISPIRKVIKSLYIALESLADKDDMYFLFDLVVRTIVNTKYRDISLVIKIV